MSHRVRLSEFFLRERISNMHLEESETSLKNGIVCEDKISALPDDLLIHILSQAQIKDAVKTMILSKRWRFLWTMMRKLDYPYSAEGSDWSFIDKSLQLHKAPLLESLKIHPGPGGSIKPDVGKWVTDAVNRCVQELKLEIFRSSSPQLQLDCLYTCKTLLKLTLSNNILVDVPSAACLWSLQSLNLTFVDYKDEDAHVRLLSICPVLKDLVVVRVFEDNMTRFSVKVPSLQRLTYRDYDSEAPGRSLVIESHGLRYVKIDVPSGYNCSIHDMPRLDVAFLFGSQKSYKFLTCFSSVMFLNLALTGVAFCSSIYFSRLVELKLRPDYFDKRWLDSLMLLLHNSPKLKVLMINSETTSGILPLCWNQPSYVPECLLSHLEIFEWKAYGGSREEKQFVAYVLENSKFLKTVGISYRYADSVDEKQKMIIEELKRMYRVSASSQLMFSPQLLGRYGD